MKKQNPPIWYKGIGIGIKALAKIFQSNKMPGIHIFNLLVDKSTSL